MYNIPCIYFRGGTSKGPCFIREDLPEDPHIRDEVILKIMGSPDERQINGMGCGDSLSNKVVVVGKSKRAGIDLDYLLCQVHINQPIVETALNCGNMLSAVAPFAIEKGLVKTTHPTTTVRIYNENTGVVMESTVETPNGRIQYEGNIHIDGVPGSGSPIKLTFLDAVGSKTGKLLPTGRAVDEIDGIAASCVDIAVPMVIVAAESLGKSGYESKDELDNDKKFMERLEKLRQKAAVKMGLGNVAQSVNPKICMIAKPKQGGTITSRYFTPFDCHDAHAVSGGLCLAAACLIDGSVANKISAMDLIEDLTVDKEIVIEHASGKISTSITTQLTQQGINFPKASFIRTARPLFEGYVYVPGERVNLEHNMSYKY